MGVIQENGVTRLTGETSKRFIYMTLHPDLDAIERRDKFLEWGNSQFQITPNGLRMDLDLSKGDRNMNNLKEILFQNMLEVSERFVEKVATDGHITKAAARASSQMAILQKVLIEAGLWNEYVDWEDERK